MARHYGNAWPFLSPYQRMDFLQSIDVSSYLTPVGLSLLVVLFLSTVVAAWVMTLFGLPGNWIILVAAIAYDWILPAESPWELGMPILVGLAVLAVFGEVCEGLAGSMGVAKRGGSRLSAVLALIGSTIGGIAGAIIGLPVPVVGSIIAVMFFASLGAMAGAVLGEDYHGRDLDGSFDVGIAAFWGRLAGTLAKTLFGAAMVAVSIVGLFT